MRTRSVGEKNQSVDFASAAVGIFLIKSKPYEMPREEYLLYHKDGIERLVHQFVRAKFSSLGELQRSESTPSRAWKVQISTRQTRFEHRAALDASVCSVCVRCLSHQIRLFYSSKAVPSIQGPSWSSYPQRASNCVGHKLRNRVKMCVARRFAAWQI